MSFQQSISIYLGLDLCKIRNCPVNSVCNNLGSAAFCKCDDGYYLDNATGSCSKLETGYNV